MSATRLLHADLKESLLNGDSFVYAHLIKFERALKTVSGKPAEAATDYAYITDASFNIGYNDGSADRKGNLNGIQTYIANRVKKVGSITETTEASPDPGNNHNLRGRPIPNFRDDHQLPVQQLPLPHITPNTSNHQQVLQDPSHLNQGVQVKMEHRLQKIPGDDKLSFAI